MTPNRRLTIRTDRPGIKRGWRFLGSFDIARGDHQHAVTVAHRPEFVAADRSGGAKTEPPTGPSSTSPLPSKMTAFQGTTCPGEASTALASPLRLCSGAWVGSNVTPKDKREDRPVAKPLPRRHVPGRRSIDYPGLQTAAAMARIWDGDPAELVSITGHRLLNSPTA